VCVCVEERKTIVDFTRYMSLFMMFRVQCIGVFSDNGSVCV